MFVQLLVDGSSPGEKSTKSQLDAWVNGLKMPFSALHDTESADFAIRALIGEPMTAFLVERSTRKIVFKGDEPSTMARLESL